MYMLIIFTLLHAKQKKHGKAFKVREKFLPFSGMEKVKKYKHTRFQISLNIK